MTSMTEFMLDKKRVSEGVKLKLYGPDGKETDEWLMVRSMWSDVYRKAKSEAAKIIAADVENADVDEEALKCNSYLVSDWSFKEACTPENVLTFLRGAPHIASRIDQAAARHGEYWGKPEASSSNGLSKNSTSKKTQTVTDAPTANA